MPGSQTDDRRIRELHAWLHAIGAPIPGKLPAHAGQQQYDGGRAPWHGTGQAATPWNARPLSPALD
jgi:hypothetical protein